MPIEPAIPQFPSPESLTRFFRTDPRARIPLARLASLLGVSRDAARAILQEEGGHHPDAGIPWSEAAALLFDAWPRIAILDSLGPEAGHVIPAQFRPAPVRWRVPIFVIRAMEHQAARACSAHPRPIDDYIADLLSAAIEPETLAAFRDDAAFVQAFHYPLLD
ncbi:MAG TPA: hypothetical protein VF432_11330 [Thermoanaerobaculia bacterium]